MGHTQNSTVLDTEIPDAMYHTQTQNHAQFTNIRTVRQKLLLSKRDLTCQPNGAVSCDGTRIVEPSSQYSRPANN